MTENSIPKSLTITVAVTFAGIKPDTVGSPALEQRFGDDSDVLRVFVLNLIFTIGSHTQGEYPVFVMEDFNAGKKAIIFLGAEKIIQPGLDGLLLDFLWFEFVHSAKDMSAPS